MTASTAPAQASLRISSSIVDHLRCPVCRNTLRNMVSGEFECATGLHRFPIVDGIPVLINESNSVFDIAQFIRHDSTFFKQRGSLARLLDSLVPRLVTNLAAAENMREFRRLIVPVSGKPVVLVLGGSIVGDGMNEIVADESITLLETDVAHGPRTQMIIDGHDIPMEDGSVDAVIVQAVLEHVVDPVRCVQEIYRVLRPDGVVYAEIPFMQPVHGGAYDFTRFSHLGLLRLFRHFQELRSGAACGPGGGAAYSITYLLQAFGAPGTSRKLLHRVGRFATFWLKYLDRFLVDRRTALDSASSLFFLGRRSQSVLSDRDLIKRYRGGL